MLIETVQQHGAADLAVVRFDSLAMAVLKAGAQAIQQRLAAVIASRAMSGRVIMTPQKEEADDIVADDLLPQKARILLVLALAQTRGRQAIQEMFYTY